MVACRLFGAESIWYAAPAATVVGAIIGVAFLVKKLPVLETEEDMRDDEEEDEEDCGNV